MHIDQGTKIPLFVVLASLPFLIMGIMWLSGVGLEAHEAKAEVAGLREILTDVRERVIRIEEKVKNN